MPAAVDASSPARFAGANAANGATFVSASFIPPGSSLVVTCLTADTPVGDAGTNYTITGGGLTWTTQVQRTGTETTAGGMSAIHTAVGAGASMTVTYTRTLAIGGGISGRVSIKVYVCTGIDTAGTPVDSITANNEGGSTTNNLTTTSITAGADGLLLVADTDWSEAGAFQSSSDLTQDSVDYPGEISVCSGYKAVSNGASVTGNLNAAGTGLVQHKWTQIIARASGGGAAGQPTQRRFGMVDRAAQAQFGHEGQRLMRAFREQIRRAA